MQKAAIVILNYNGKQLLKQFLPNVIAYSKSYPVFIVDNASTDDSLPFIQQHYPSISCIKLAQNKGFTGGYNQALKQIKAHYYILLNPDVAVTPQWIEPILALLTTHPDIAACQPKILAYHNKHQFEYAGAAGGFIDKLGYPFCRGRLFDTLALDQKQYDDTREIFWASGACLFIKADVFWKLGGFDESLFAYYEEIDLCWRIKKIGCRVYYCGASTVYHVGSATIGKNNPYQTYLKFRNRALVLYKHTSKHFLSWKHGLRLLLDLIAALQALIRGKPKHSWAIIKAQLDFFKLKRNYQPPKQPYSINQVYDGLLPFAYFIKQKKDFNALNKAKFRTTKF